MLIDTIIVILLIVIIALLIYKPSNSSINKITKYNDYVILDSCALIDGRVVELSRVGFLSNNVIIPSFIIRELQLLADGRDAYKRERARFGLLIAQQLQATPELNVIIDETKTPSNTTDDKLVELAKIKNASLFTTDYNLNQVATISGVKVLNLNELAHSLRPNALPGEKIFVTILQLGTNKEQGVGYLEDGTMIVVDGAVKDIGKNIEVEITKSHQTVAGKMLFAKKITSKNYNNKSKQKINSKLYK
jgi:uncharacterized protein YacL